MELSLKRAYLIDPMTQKSANLLVSLSFLNHKVCIVLVVLVDFQKVLVLSTFNSKLEEF